ncbi:hypothetical protein ACGK9U_04340 [Mariniflexile sp. HNIBRBA6329]|uniref:hypothetical protein n=1 Tax=Mariniflexile sp. HNIBRBA6329 TaxID=3373088 RepID=UPI00374718B1
MKFLFSIGLVFIGLTVKSQNLSVNQNEIPEIKITSSMSPPVWALEQRKLFDLYNKACKLFAEKYVAENGYLKVVERWGGNDGPDDAMENFAHWPLVYALGGPESILEIYKKAWEGHLIQFTKAKVPNIEMAKEGIYYKEFITSFDWEHNGEGLSAFNFYGLVNPKDTLYQKRVIRFAGFYMNEDPEAQNYDTKHKIIRSLHNGSRGPKLTFASETDWGGEPVEGFPERLNRYSTAGNIKGDHPLNLVSTTLAMNAFMLTGDKKYSDWLLEYTTAWYDRIIGNNGNIPTNIGLDGTIGGEWDGKWYGGTFGWNFWPESNVRNYFIRGPRIALGSAFLLTNNKKFITPLRLQMQNLYAAKKMQGSTILLPNKYGENGWYGYMPERRFDVLRDIYLWSMDPTDLQHLNKDAWISFLLGNNPNYPEQALKKEQDFIVRCIERMNKDTSKDEIRQTDEPQKVNPVKAGTLVELTTGGNDPGIAGNILHSRVRYFNPVLKRAGLPDHVAALVEKITPEGIELTLVNTNQTQSRKVILQSGAYGEHDFTEVIIDGKSVALNGNKLLVVLKKGAGSKIILKMDLYKNSPTLVLPW